MRFQLTKQGFQDFLGSGNGFYDMLTVSTLGLFQNAVTYDWLRAYADLTLANFTGYAPVDLSASIPAGPYTDGVKQEAFFKTPMRSLGTCTAVPNTLYGAVVYRTAGPNTLFGMVVFDSPLLISVGDTLRLNLLYGVGQSTEDSGFEVDSI